MLSFSLLGPRSSKPSIKPIYDTRRTRPRLKYITRATPNIINNNNNNRHTRSALSSFFPPPRARWQTVVHGFGHFCSLFIYVGDADPLRSRLHFIAGRVHGRVPGMGWKHIPHWTRWNPFHRGSFGFLPLRSPLPPLRRVNVVCNAPCEAVLRRPTGGIRNQTSPERVHNAPRDSKKPSHELLTWNETFSSLPRRLLFFLFFVSLHVSFTEELESVGLFLALRSATLRMYGLPLN